MFGCPRFQICLSIGLLDYGGGKNSTSLNAQ